MQIAIVLLIVLVWWPLAVFSAMYILTTSALDAEVVMVLLRFGAIVSLVSLIPLLLISVFIMKYRSQLLGRRWMATKKLERKWPQLIGFREYTRLCYTDKLTFSDKLTRKKVRVKVLPYAIAFNAAKDWRDIVT